MKIQDYLAQKLYLLRRRIVPISAFEREKMADMYRHDWDGVTAAADLKYGWSEGRIALAKAARAADWRTVKRLLLNGQNPNDYQICTPEWNSVLHWAAEKKAPRSLVHLALACGAWRALPNAAGVLPSDIAVACGHDALAEILRAQFVRPFDANKLAATQTHFHAHLLKNEIVHEHQLRLPELAILMELQEPRMSFRIPGMYGAYYFWLDDASDQNNIIVESTCRIVSGPVPRYACSPEGVRRLPSTWNQ